MISKIFIATNSQYLSRMNLGYKVSQWLEQSVFKGIDKNFIRSMTFAILSRKAADKTHSKGEALETFR